MDGGTEKKHQHIRPCEDTSDCVELSRTSGLYLKPVARLSITVTLPQLKAGQAISNFEVMQKLKGGILPIKFSNIKVTKSTLEFIRFDAEIDNKKSLSQVIGKLDQKGIRLAGFSDLLKIKASEAKTAFPTRHEWDSFFRDAKHMNEMKPGERPDTVYLTDLPCRWFAHLNDVNGNKPSEFVLKKVFETFGEVRCVDIPMLDPYRSRMTSAISGVKSFPFTQESIFEAYVQFKEYIGFAKCMHALQGKKLVFVEMGQAYCASIGVDFDKSKHLSEQSIKQRGTEREVLQQKERSAEEKLRMERENESRKKEAERKQVEEEKRQQRKARRKAKQLKKKAKAEKKKQRKQKKKEEKLKLEKMKEEERLAHKIAAEERKLLVAQRKLESIRLLDELLEKVKLQQQIEAVKLKEEELFKHIDKHNKKKIKEIKKKELEEMKRQEMLSVKERELRDKLIKSYKLHEEEQLELQRERVKLAIQGKLYMSKSDTDTLACLSPVSSNTDDSMMSSDSSDEGQSSHHSSRSSSASSRSSSRSRRRHSSSRSKRKASSDRGGGDSERRSDEDGSVGSRDRTTTKHRESYYENAHHNQYPSYYEGGYREHYAEDNFDFRNRGRGRGRGMRGMWRARGLPDNRGHFFRQSNFRNRFPVDRYDRDNHGKNYWYNRKYNDGGRSRSRSRSRSYRSRSRSYNSRSRSRGASSRSRSRSYRSDSSKSGSRSRKHKNARSKSRSKSKDRSYSNGNVEYRKSESRSNSRDRVEAHRSRDRSYQRSRSRSRSNLSPSGRGARDSQYKKRSRTASRDRYSRSPSADAPRDKYRRRGGGGGRDSDVDASSGSESPKYRRYHPRHYYDRPDFHFRGGRGNRGGFRQNFRRGFRGNYPRFWRGPRGPHRGGHFQHRHNYNNHRDNYNKREYHRDNSRYSDEERKRDDVDEYQEMYQKYFSSLAEREERERAHKGDDQRAKRAFSDDDIGGEGRKMK